MGDRDRLKTKTVLNILPIRRRYSRRVARSQFPEQPSPPVHKASAAQRFPVTVATSHLEVSEVFLHLQVWLFPEKCSVWSLHFHGGTRTIADL